MSDITRQKTIDYLYYLKTHYPKNLIIPEYIDFAISSLETDEAYQLEYESTTKNDLGVDCIDRAEALKLMQDNWHTHNGDWAMQESMDDIRALPLVTPQAPRKGHWIEEFNDLEGEVRFTCSSCGKYQLFGTDFCYYCGSDNREVVEE